MASPRPRTATTIRCARPLTSWGGGRSGKAEARAESRERGIADERRYTRLKRNCGRSISGQNHYPDIPPNDQLPGGLGRAPGPSGHGYGRGLCQLAAPGADRLRERIPQCRARRLSSGDWMTRRVAGQAPTADCAGNAAGAWPCGSSRESYCLSVSPSWLGLRDSPSVEFSPVPAVPPSWPGSSGNRPGPRLLKRSPSAETLAGPPAYYRLSR